MNTTMTNRRLASLVIAAAAATVMAGVALATPASGVVGTILVRAGFVEPVDIKFKVWEGERQEIIQVRGAQHTVMQQIVIAPGGSTGWHSHPGPAVALVKAGELTLYSSEDPTCTGRTYTAGQGFVDTGQGHVHIARNLTQNPTEVWVTYFDVPPDESVRIDAAAPGTCGF
jgi:quercetin dioxygenase-like cupin family protein